MSIEKFNKYLKENGQQYYSEVLATKIIDKLHIFTNDKATKEELIEITTEVIQNQFYKGE